MKNLLELLQLKEELDILIKESSLMLNESDISFLYEAKIKKEYIDDVISFIKTKKDLIKNRLMYGPKIKFGKDLHKAGQDPNAMATAAAPFLIGGIAYKKSKEAHQKCKSLGLENDKTCLKNYYKQHRWI